MIPRAYFRENLWTHHRGTHANDSETSCLEFWDRLSLNNSHVYTYGKERSREGLRQLNSSKTILIMEPWGMCRWVWPGRLIIKVPKVKAAYIVSVQGQVVHVDCLIRTIASMSASIPAAFDDSLAAYQETITNYVSAGCLSVRYSSFMHPRITLIDFDRCWFGTS